MRVLNTLPLTKTVAVMVGFLSAMMHFFVELSCTT
jgi:hypothetical protein